MKNTVLKLWFSLMFCLLLCSQGVSAEQPLLIVLDNWAPYGFEENGVQKGMDLEVVNAVFKKMGRSVKFEIYPWKRCISMIEQKTTDMILDISITPERREFLYYPDEPISIGTTVFFIKKNKKISFSKLEDLYKLRIGAMSGYEYCDEIDQSPIGKNAVRLNKLEQSFNMLFEDRIDAVIEVDAVGYYTANNMKIIDKINIIPKAKYCTGGNYLAFAKKPGLDRISAQFSRELKEFKKTEKYKQILLRYGVKVK